MALNRRHFVQALGAMATVAGAPALRAATGPARLPDIIFIMADDLGYADLSCTGSHHIRTPAIDSLARDGALLGQGYANSAICSPTRTALLSGCYQQRFALGLQEPIIGDVPKEMGLSYGRPTIASVLRDRGYRTKLIGKWHLGRPPLHGPLQHGYDEFLGISDGAADYFRHYMVEDGKNVGMGLVKGNDEIERAGYLTDLFGDEAVNTIRTAGDAPLLLSLHFNAPHWPWEGRGDEAIARTITSSHHNAGGSLGTYKAMVEAMDQNIAKLLAALKETGRADNAVVVFTSDNGGERFSETWPFVGGKGELLEGGIRVPILIRWPGHIAARTRSDQPMISMDFLPTLLAIAGGTAKPGLFDGMDLSAQLTGKKPLAERTLFWRFKANDQAAVRQGDWKYLRLGGKEHLFDVGRDPGERVELADAEPTRFAALKDLWREWNATMLPYPPDSFSAQVKNSRPDRY